VLGLIFAAVFALQLLDGAYVNELGGHPDEAAHYVTGRRVADYVTTDLGVAPLMALAFSGRIAATLRRIV
jgi:hypothetical protein